MLVPLRQALALAPNGLPPHWHLAVCYAELGRQEEAQAEAAEVLRIYPQFSVEAWRSVMSYCQMSIVKLGMGSSALTRRTCFQNIFNSPFTHRSL